MARRWRNTAVFVYFMLLGEGDIIKERGYYKVSKKEAMGKVNSLDIGSHPTAN